MVLIVGGRKIKATDLRLATMHGMVVGGYDEYGWGWKVDTLGIVRSTKGRVRSTYGRGTYAARSTEHGTYLMS